MDASPSSIPASPERLRAFVQFFQNYMSLSSVVVAALPIPITASGVIPTYKGQTTSLSTYTPLMCFLLLGFIFYSRHKLARLMFLDYFTTERKALRKAFLLRKAFFRSLGFAIALLPALLIIGSVFFIIQYHRLLQASLIISKAEMTLEQTIIEATVQRRNNPDLQISEQNVDNLIINLRGEDKSKNLQTAREALSNIKPLFNIIPNLKDKVDQITSESVLSRQDSFDIPYAQELMFCYMLIFLCAEGAFILMAIKEHLQDLIGLSEMDLIRGPSTS
jgi:hypothetical protein